MEKTSLIDLWVWIFILNKNTFCSMEENYSLTYNHVHVIWLCVCFGGSLQTSSSPVHPSFRGSSPSSDHLLSSPSSRRDRSYTFDPSTVVVEKEAQDERRSYKHLLNIPSKETLPLASSKSPTRPCIHSETSSPAHLCQTDHLKSREGSQPLLHYGEYSQSEGLNVYFKIN